ncbi:MAG: 50S ribosomal protein L6 [Alphaproteobacteria bacterium]|nr:MAG: 50S ribosomal protein L6 [Alphaproteobacteria bacterium]
MSRIGKKPVAIPDGVTASIDGDVISVKGPKGEASAQVVKEVSVTLAETGVVIMPRNETKRARSMWGMQRSLVNNLVEGVSKGFSKELELRGTGYRAQLQGTNLRLQLGFSHEVIFPPPEGIDIQCPSQTEIVVSGIDKQKVGQAAAKIRSYRPPEPYKGKGIRYKSEYVFMKEGKKK